MVDEPIRFIEHFAKAGCDNITVHVEACKNVQETLDKIKSFGVGCGLSIKPQTPVSAVEPYLDQLDLVLVMSVNPGFGGQGLIPETLEKVKQLAQIKGDRGYLIEIDGGVNSSTIAKVFESGVDVAVTGSAFFGAKEKADFVNKLSKGKGERR